MSEGGVKAVPHLSNAAINGIVDQLVNILLGSYVAICMTLLYFDLRIRKEGFDLELAAREHATIVS
jgi:hypothetical protein